MNAENIFDRVDALIEAFASASPYAALNVEAECAPVLIHGRATRVVTQPFRISAVALQSYISSDRPKQPIMISRRRISRTSLLPYLKIDLPESNKPRSGAHDQDRPNPPWRTKRRAQRVDNDHYQKDSDV